MTHRRGGEKVGERTGVLVLTRKHLVFHSPKAGALSVHEIGRSANSLVFDLADVRTVESKTGTLLDWVLRGTVSADYVAITLYDGSTHFFHVANTNDWVAKIRESSTGI
jgi:hypothetical protein